MSDGRDRSRTGVYAALAATAIAAGLGVVGAAGAHSTDDTTPPVTTHSLDPAEPGEGGTYRGPVGVTLSAVDPEEDSPEPETHDVNAVGSTWNPDALDVAFGDVVRWNFSEATAGAPHDVWLIEPRDPPNSAGTKVSPGDFVLPGGPPVSATLDEPGTWTYVCKIHSFISEGRWRGMVGTAAVGEGGGTASGVDFTEYRMTTGGTTGAWVRADNTANEHSFETSFTVSATGTHIVEYRSADNAGNPEESESFAFAVAGAATTPNPQPGPGAAHVVTPRPDGGGDAVRPTISAPKLKALRRGVRVRFRLSEPATVTVRIKRSGSRRVLASARVQAGAGTRTVTVRSKRLRKGRYVVDLRARDASGNRSALTTRRLTLPR
jgi:plastocyanin